jgi:hypothetical protein
MAAIHLGVVVSDCHLLAAVAMTSTPQVHSQLNSLSDLKTRP